MSGMLFPSRHPGEGRGPVAKAEVMIRCANQFAFPDWAPAYAGVALRVEARGGAHG